MGSSLSAFYTALPLINSDHRFQNASGTQVNRRHQNSAVFLVASLSFRFNIIAMGLMFWLKLEIFVGRTKEHFATFS
jgi:hypothetical protein